MRAEAPTLEDCAICSMLKRFAKWWTLSVLILILAVIAWAYIDAQRRGTLPLHHPWPALALVSGAVAVHLIGARSTTRRIYISRFAVSLCIAMSAIMYCLSLR